jgi:hypothetical protein
VLVAASAAKMGFRNLSGRCVCGDRKSGRLGGSNPRPNCVGPPDVSMTPGSEECMRPHEQERGEQWLAGCEHALDREGWHVYPQQCRAVPVESMSRRCELGTV